MEPPHIQPVIQVWFVPSVLARRTLHHRLAIRGAAMIYTSTSTAKADHLFAADNLCSAAKPLLALNGSGYPLGFS